MRGIDAEVQTEAWAAANRDVYRLPHLVGRIWTEKNKKGKKKEENEDLTLLVMFVVLMERRISALDIFPIFIRQLSFVFKLKYLFYVIYFRTVASLQRFILSFLSILPPVFGLCLLPSPPVLNVDHHRPTHSARIRHAFYIMFKTVHRSADISKPFSVCHSFCNFSKRLLEIYISHQR